MAQAQLQSRAQETFPLHVQSSPAADEVEDSFHEQQVEAPEHIHKKSVLEKMKDQAHKLKTKIKDASGAMRRSSEDDQKENSSSGNEDEERATAAAATTDLHDNTEDEGLYGDVSSGLKAIKLDDESKGLHDPVHRENAPAKDAFESTLPAGYTDVRESTQSGVPVLVSELGLPVNKAPEEKNPASHAQLSGSTSAPRSGVEGESLSHEPSDAPVGKEGKKDPFSAASPEDVSSHKLTMNKSAKDSGGVSAGTAAADQSFWTEKMIAAKDAALSKLGYGSGKGEEKTAMPENFESNPSDKTGSALQGSQSWSERACDNSNSPGAAIKSVVATVPEKLRQAYEHPPQKGNLEHNAGETERSSIRSETSEKPKFDDRAGGQQAISSAVRAKDALVDSAAIARETVTSKLGLGQESAEGEGAKKEMTTSTETSESMTEKLRTIVSKMALQLEGVVVSARASTASVLSPGKEEMELAEMITSLLSSPSHIKDQFGEMLTGSTQKDASASAPEGAKGLLGKVSNAGSYFRRNSGQKNEVEPQPEEGGIPKEESSSISDKLSSEIS